MDSEKEGTNQWKSTVMSSIAAIQKAHTALLRRKKSLQEGEELPSEEIKGFIDEVRVGGRVIADWDSRDIAQGIIDYWYGVLVSLRGSSTAYNYSLNLEKFTPGIEATQELSSSEVSARFRKKLDQTASEFDSRSDESRKEALRKILLGVFALGQMRDKMERIQLLKEDKIFEGDNGEKKRQIVDELLERGLFIEEAGGLDGEKSYVLADDSLFHSWEFLNSVVSERRSLRDAAYAWKRSAKRENFLIAHDSPQDDAAFFERVSDYREINNTENEFLSEIRARNSRKFTEQSTKQKRALILVSIVALTAISLAILSFFMWRKTMEYSKELKTQLRKLEIKNDTLKYANGAFEKLQENAAAEIFIRDVELASERSNVARARERLFSRRGGGGGGGGGGRPSTGFQRPEPNVSMLPASVRPSLAYERAEMQAIFELRARSAFRTEIAAVLKDHKRPITDLEFAKDGRLASSGKDPLVRIWNENGDQVKTVHGSDSGVNCIAFDPGNSNLLAMGGKGSTVRIFNFETGKTGAYQKHSGAITSLSFSSEGYKIISSSTDETVRIWNPLDTEQRIMEPFDFQTPIDWASFAPDAANFVASPREPTEAVYLIQYPQSGSTFEKLQLVTSGADLKGETPAESASRKAVFSPDGKWIASGGYEGKAMIWKNDGKVHKELAKHAGFVHQAVFSTDSLSVITCCDDGKIRIWDVDDGKLLQTLEGHSEAVIFIESSRDGKFLLSGSKDNTANIWYRQEGRYYLSRTLTSHANDISAMAINEKSSQIAIGDQDGVVIIWNIVNRDISSDTE